MNQYFEEEQLVLRFQEGRQKKLDRKSKRAWLKRQPPLNSPTHTGKRSFKQPAEEEPKQTRSYQHLTKELETIENERESQRLMMEEYYYEEMMESEKRRKQEEEDYYDEFNNPWDF